MMVTPELAGFSFVFHSGAHQNMPDILTGSLVATEANASTKKTLSSPHVAGHHLQLTNPHGFSAVNLHLHLSLHVGFQKFLQQVTFFILEDSKGRR